MSINQPPALDHNHRPGVISRRPIAVRSIVVSCVCFVLAGLGVLIFHYRFVGTSSGFESFMDSQSVGVRFKMTTIGIIIKSYWTSLEKGNAPATLAGTKPLTILSAIRTCELYGRLSKGCASARDTILVEPCSHAITAFFSNLRRGNIFLSYMASMVVLSEVLTGALSVFHLALLNRTLHIWYQ